MNIRTLKEAAAVLGITLGCVLVTVPLLAQEAQQAQPNTQQEGQAGPPGAPESLPGSARKWCPWNNPIRRCQSVSDQETGR
jgi:hypothetical protein